MYNINKIVLALSFFGGLLVLVFFAFELINYDYTIDIAGNVYKYHQRYTGYTMIFQETDKGLSACKFCLIFSFILSAFLSVISFLGFSFSDKKEKNMLSFLLPVWSINAILFLISIISSRNYLVYNYTGMPDHAYTISTFFWLSFGITVFEAILSLISFILRSQKK